MRSNLRRVVVLLLLAAAAPSHALIIAPSMSDTDYAQLRSELMSRIPEYAPGWTDYSASDPGVTLLELFAFTSENLAYDISLDIPFDLLWGDFDSQEESTQGEAAYVLADAAWLARHPNDIRATDWLQQEGIDPAWTYSELREAAVRAVPEPASLALLATGLLLVAAGRRTGRRLES